MAGLHEKTLLLISLALVLLAGCAEIQTDPVSPENIMVATSAITIKEFHERNVTVNISNNDDMDIYAAKIVEFAPLTVTKTTSCNLSGKNENVDSSVISAHVVAPAFETNTNGSAVIISYLSGTDKKGQNILKTKSVPVEITILPDVQLQFTGFVKDLTYIRSTPAASWDLDAGDNAVITYSVKNNGESTVAAGMLSIVVQTDNELVSESVSRTINQSLQREETSYTKGIEIPVKENASSVTTDLYVRLMYGDHIVDEKKLVLNVQ